MKIFDFDSCFWSYCLQVPDGFISHFYSISEHVSPVLAFGFLGPRQHLSEVCTIFKVRRYGTKNMCLLSSCKKSGDCLECKLKREVW